MHHKRGRSKNQRAGCLMCKPHKMNGYGHEHSMHAPNKVGGSNIKKEFLAREDIKDVSYQD